MTRSTTPARVSPLPRVAPEAVGIASAAVIAFLDAIEAAGLELHSFMLLRHGQVAAEGWWKPYGPDIRHVLFSLSKSFTSTAVGFAVQEGLLRVDDRVIDFFPTQMAALAGTFTDAAARANLEAMRVSDLLTMRTGHVDDTLGSMVEVEDGDWPRRFLAVPVTRAPGTHFVYNSGATYMAGRIVQQLTGQRLIDYLKPRLFRPLGIGGAWWERCPQGYDTGGWGLNLRTEDIARFGQFYLQRGQWQGKQLLDAAWVDAATARQGPSRSEGDPDWCAGYGYQFWQCRHGAYRGDGAFCQFCVVMPAQDAVVAMTAGSGGYQAVLDQVWDHLLPAMQDAELPDDPDAAARLAARLAALHIPLQAGEPITPLAVEVSGNRYVFEKNDQDLKWLEVDFSDEPAEITLKVGRRLHRFAVGIADWEFGKSRYDLRPWDRTRAVAAHGAWSAADTYRMRLCFYETPFTPTLTLRFHGDRVTFDHCSNASFDELQRAPVTGHVA